jgi:hypothetical protein
MKTEDVMMHLQAANPVGTSDTDDWPASDRGQEILRGVISIPVYRSETRRPHRRGLPRLAFPVVAVIAAIVAAVLFVPITGTHQGASAAAAEVLHAAARVAEKQPQTHVPTDGYRYTKSKDAYRSYYDACSIPSNSDATPLPCPRQPPEDWAFSVLVPHVREIWVTPDGSGRLLVKTGEPRFLGPRDRETWEAAGRPELDRPGTTDESFGPDGLSYTNFSEYSTDPDELYDQIRSKAEGHGPSTDAEMLVLVGDLLRETVAPPDLRAALFRVAARIPGVELVGEVTDPAGRKGVAVARTSDDAGFLERNELIFDPDTSELLAERQILLEPVDWIDAEPGTVIGYAVYLNSGVVDATSERP